MSTYLIVANRTLPSPTLAHAIAERLARGDARFHVVVPLTPVGSGFTWNEDESRIAAQGRLDAILQRLRDLGAAETSGEIGCQDPVAAVHDAIASRQVDEIILSTLPAGLSRWLGQDVPSRLRDGVDVPITVVTAKEAAASR